MPNSKLESISNNDLLDAYNHPQKLLGFLFPNIVNKGGYSLKDVDNIFIYSNFIIMYEDLDIVWKYL